MIANKPIGAIPAIVILLTLGAPATAETPQEIAETVSPSVVLLAMEDSNGQPLSLGSGFVVCKDVVATNMHVIEGAARGYAKLVGNKTKHNIRGIVASDAARDLVLLSVDGLEADALSIGDSNAVAVGDAVYAVGNPRGLEGTFSAGIVSSVRKVGDDSLLQITAPISPGSSGGPVVNSKGEVIGVAVATFKGGQNLNFAIPSQYLSALIPTIGAPVDLPKAAEARKSKKEKSILDEMGGRSLEGVSVFGFAWNYPGPHGLGDFTLSLRNHLRENVRDIVCLVVIYDGNRAPLDFSMVSTGTVPAGLSKRVKGEFGGGDIATGRSVQRLTTRDKADQPFTKIEFRILYFDIVNPDEPVDEQSNGPQRRGLPSDGNDTRKSNAATTEGRNASSLQDAEAELTRLEKRLAEAAARIAPAGAGPDLIESRIEGDFEGWDGETIFKLDNGQIWQQVMIGFTFTYKFRPKVTIFKTHGTYKMKVDGVSGTIFVKRLK